MRSATRSLVLSVGLALAAVAAQAGGVVQVSYIQPDKFADAGDSRRDAEGNLSILKHHLESLASRYLRDGQKLSIEVLDVDLAGEVHPSRRLHQDVRLLNGGADWPRISLRYTLESAGQAPVRAEQTVADMDYLHHLNGYASDEPLRYEKQMLNEWFAAQFGAAATQ
jgi:hypothetical protein